jgi:hypothetical protein
VNSEQSSFKVIRAWTAMYADPIDIRAGEPLVTGQTDPEWPGWIWCTDPRGRSGWTPIDSIHVAADGKTGTITCDFTARELTVREGDVVTPLRVLHGWCWARDARGNEGWLPAAHLAREVT